MAEKERDKDWYTQRDRETERDTYRDRKRGTHIHTRRERDRLTVALLATHLLIPQTCVQRNQNNSGGKPTISHTKTKFDVHIYEKQDMNYV